MKIRCFATPNDLLPGDLDGAAAIVIDTLRMTSVTAAATMQLSQIILPTNRRSPSKSRCPNFCATGMANPAHTPLHSPSTRNVMEPVEPTPASASTPRNLPTTMVSTIL